MKKILTLAAILFLSIHHVSAQTWPAAFNLSAANFSFNNWPAASTAGIYPANMGFYTLNNTSGVDPLEAAAISADYTATYSLSTGTRLNGLGSGGFSFINTGTGTNMGAAVVALNTTSRNNIQLTWTGKTVTSNNREYEIRCYYRVGTTGTWTALLNAPNDTMKYVRSATTGDSVVKGPLTLPAAANNQTVVQICWKYFQTYSNTATGTRAELGMNSINITSSPISTTAPAITVTPIVISNFITAANTTSISDSFTVSGANLTANIAITAPASFEICNTLGGSYLSNILLAPASGSVPATKIYVRFHPLTTGSFSGNAGLTSTGATTQNVAVSGNTPLPGITVSTIAIANSFFANVNSISSSDTFSVSGTSLSTDITVAAPASFEVATSASGPYNSSVTLAQTGGTVANTLVYVRFHPTAAGTVTDSVHISATGVTTKHVKVTGYTINSSNPVAFNVSSGIYSMMQWDSSSNAGTYPANMIFHTANTDTPPLTSAPLPNNWICGYHLSARPRVRGLDSMGFSFINTSSPQYDDCSGGATTKNMFMGGAILALNTNSASNAVLKYNVGLVKQGDGTIPRVYNIRLQYRLDSTSSFTDMTPTTEYTTAGKTTGDLETFNITLPANFLNISYMQFRWLYYVQTVTGASGSRPEIRIDNIIVSSTTSVANISNGKETIVAYPNPVASGERLYFEKAVSGNIVDVYGRTVRIINSETSISTDGISAGMYTLITKDGNIIRVIVK